MHHALRQKGVTRKKAKKTLNTSEILSPLSDRFLNIFPKANVFVNTLVTPTERNDEHATPFRERKERRVINATIYIYKT